MDRWKYMVVEVKGSFLTGVVSAERLAEELDKAGTQGWELVQVVQAHPLRGAKLVFKRLS